MLVFEIVDCRMIGDGVVRKDSNSRSFDSSSE